MEFLNANIDIIQVIERYGVAVAVMIVLLSGVFIFLKWMMSKIDEVFRASREDNARMIDNFRADTKEIVSKFERSTKESTKVLQAVVSAFNTSVNDSKDRHHQVIEKQDELSETLSEIRGHTSQILDHVTRNGKI